MQAGMRHGAFQGEGDGGVDLHPVAAGLPAGTWAKARLPRHSCRASLRGGLVPHGLGRACPARIVSFCESCVRGFSPVQPPRVYRPGSLLVSGSGRPEAAIQNEIQFPSDLKGIEGCQATAGRAGWVAITIPTPAPILLTNGGRIGRGRRLGQAWALKLQHRLSYRPEAVVVSAVFQAAATHLTWWSLRADRVQADRGPPAANPAASGRVRCRAGSEAAWCLSSRRRSGRGPHGPIGRPPPWPTQSHERPVRRARAHMRSTSVIRLFPMQYSGSLLPV